jgi:preprotein translocase subunit SecF
MTDDDLTPAAASAAVTADKQFGRQAGFVSRLSTGTGAFNVLGPRKIYYIVSTALVVGSILLIVFRGFQYGIDFAGGTTLTFEPADGAASVSTTQVAQTVTSATGVEVDAVQTVGSQI